MKQKIIKFSGERHQSQGSKDFQEYKQLFSNYYKETKEDM